MFASGRHTTRADDFSLVVVDAGARGGLVPLARVARRVILYAFDPDPSACGELAACGDYREVHVECAALTGQDGEATLRVTRNPGLSSLLDADPDAYEALFGHMEGFAHWRSAFEIVDRRVVPAVTLDTWVERHGIDMLDFLKVDTQGTELDVLNGGRRLLSRGGVEIVQVEVALRPFYKRQPDFTAVDGVLKELGYELVDCRFAHERVGPTRRDGIGVWGEEPRWTASADATYVLRRSPARNEGQDHRARARALVLGQLGYGSTAAAVLAEEAMWTDDEIESFLREWARPSAAEQRRSWLRHRLPPALVDVWRRL